MKNSSVNIFIAYAREDKKYLDQMIITLSPLKDKGINVWYDGEIVPGIKWDSTIKEKLHGSDIVVLLISRYALASDYIRKIEIPEAMDRHSKGDTIVLPIILTPCSWQDSQISSIQLLPRDGTPISKWEDGHEDAFYTVECGIRETINLVLEKKEEQKRLKEEEKRRKKEEKKRIEEEKQRKADTTTISKKKLAELEEAGKRLTELIKASNTRTLGQEEISDLSNLLQKDNIKVSTEKSLGKHENLGNSKSYNILSKIITVPRITPYLLIYFSLCLFSFFILNQKLLKLGNYDSGLPKTLDYFKSLEFWATTLLSGLFLVLIFSLIIKYIKKLQTHLFATAISSFIIGSMVIFLLFKMGLELDSSGNNLLIQINSYISLFIASIIVWRYYAKFHITGIIEGGERYDVFISYSNADSQWVRQNLFNPLNELRKPDGSKLNIFFAENSIGIGEAFTLKYMKAIVDSKLFIPVMSKDYYAKNHCRNEMDLAVKRKIERLIDLCIIAFDFDYIPEEFRHINSIEINNQSDFIESIKQQLSRIGILD